MSFLHSTYIKTTLHLCTVHSNKLITYKRSNIMSKVSIYLNFQGNTEEAFNFYKSVFKTAFVAPIMYNKDIPAHEGMPSLPENEKGKVMHVCLPILGGTQIMGTDMLENMGHKLKIGNNITINLEPDTREETDILFLSTFRREF